MIIQVPFKDLGLAIEVDFKLLPGNLPSVLPLRDLNDNGLYISLQRNVVKFVNREKGLQFDNYFLIHKWGVDDALYSIYKEGELRKIHISFGYPSS